MKKSRSQKQLLGALAAVSNLGASAFDKKVKDVHEGGLRIKIPKNATADQLRAAQLAILLAERARGVSDSSLSSADRAGIEKVVSSFVAGVPKKYKSDDFGSQFEAESDGSALLIGDMRIGERTGYGNAYIDLCPHQVAKIDNVTQASTIDAARGRYAARVLYHLLGTGLTTRAIDNVSDADNSSNKDKQHYLFLGADSANAEHRMRLKKDTCYHIRLSKKQIEAARQNAVYAGLAKKDSADAAAIDSLISTRPGIFSDSPGARKSRSVNGLAGSELTEHLGAMKRRRRKAKKSSSKRPARKSARRVSRRKRK